MNKLINIIRRQKDLLTLVNREYLLEEERLEETYFAAVMQYQREIIRLLNDIKALKERRIEKKKGANNDKMGKD